MIKKKIALIGGSGFIGAALVKLLQNSAEIVNYDIKLPANQQCKTILVDVRDKEAVIKKIVPVDWIILLAAEHRDDVTPKSLYYDVNVEGAINVLTAADTKSIKKILFVSSVSVYGLHRMNCNEDEAPQPSNDYGKSKWLAEEKLRQWQAKDKEQRTLIVVRPTVIFGPNSRGNVYQLLQQLKSGKFIMIGNGNNKKSMAYIENVVQFFKFIIDNDFKRYQVFNYTDKPDFSMNELINFLRLKLNKKKSRLRIPYFIGYAGGLFFDVFAKLTNKKFSISSVRIKKWCATTQFCSKKLLQTGFQPYYTLQEGLSKTITEMQQPEVQKQNSVLP